VSSVRLAATVILARPPFEIYLTRRSARSAFAPDAFVFPGGTIEDQDTTESARARTLGLDSDRMARHFRAAVPAELPCDEPPSAPENAASLFVAALRELFEEAGILLARTAAGERIEAASSDWESVTAQRTGLRDGRLTFAAFLTARGWYADASALTLFSHWITPRSEPRRYNTYFFFAVAPPDQAAYADAFETHDGIWISPSAALERERAGTLRLVYPTIKHLERLERFANVDAALEYSSSKPILTILPNDSGDAFAIPPALENAW
jgi:8-oxo-dGTP pyrophosphatase MutT (NUDIX family)